MLAFSLPEQQAIRRADDCQGLNLDELHFHFNPSLSRINSGKGEGLEKGAVLSMASVKSIVSQSFFYATIYFHIRDEA